MTVFIMNIKIMCTYSELAFVKDLKPNPENPNKHPKEQIDHLVHLIKVHGWRHPIIVSKKTGTIATDHGRLIAAIILKMETVPVDYQDFDSYDSEFSFVVADNAVALQAELDIPAIQLKVLDMGQDFDPYDLGIADLFIPNVTESNDEKKEVLETLKICPECGHEF